jgi:hypothetical protein
LPAFWPGGLRPPVVLDPRTTPGQPRGGSFFIRRGGDKEEKREREGSFFFRFKESFTVLRERGRGRGRRHRGPLPPSSGRPLKPKAPYLHERAVRAHLEELPPEVREALEDLFGGDLPDPVDLVAGHYQV